MLQTYKSQSVEGGEGGSQRDLPSSAGVPPAELLAASVGFLRRQFPIILSVLPLTIGLAAIYLLTTPPLYQGEARIIIDTGKVQVFQQSIFGEDPITLAYLDSQIEILKSENFALSIIKNLELTQYSEFVGSSGGPISRAVNLLFHPFARSEPKSESEVKQHAVRVFEGRLTVSRVGMTNVIEIAFQSNDPDRAPRIANAVADGFIVDQLDARYQTIRKTMAWLQDRLIELRGQVSAAERAVVDYKTRNNIVDTGGHLIGDQQLAELNTAVIKARAGAVETKARLDAVSQILSNDNLDPAATEVATVADTLHNEIITKLRQQYLAIAQREQLFSTRLGHDHLAVVNLRNQMREIRRSILDELKQIAAAYKSDLDIAKAREDSLEKSLATSVTGSQTTNKAQIELRQLESAAQSYSKLYENLQQRYTESVQQQSFPTAEARVITRASRPLGKTTPKSMRTLLVATMGGLLVGLGLALLREISDRVFRTGGQVEAKLNTECLALVPMIKLGAKTQSIGTNAPGDIATARIIPINTGLFRHVIDSPLSRFTESIRAVKVGADLGGVRKSNRVIGITSSLPGEGKSTIAASLALLSAHGGARVILVDCDLRVPSLSRQLAPNAAMGLIDVITDTAKLDEVIWTDPSSKLSFLPVAARSRLTHTSEILASDALKRLFDRLRETYDYVIVDLSPLAPVIDVRSTAHLVDTYAFVIEWGKTTIDIAEHALSAAHGVYENLLGVVLNKVDLNLLLRYENHRGDYYYNRQYARYGYTD